MVMGYTVMLGLDVIQGTLFFLMNVHICLNLLKISQLSET